MSTCNKRQRELTVLSCQRPPSCPFSTAGRFVQPRWWQVDEVAAKTVLCATMSNLQQVQEAIAVDFGKMQTLTAQHHAQNSVDMAQLKMGLEAAASQVCLNFDRDIVTRDCTGGKKRI